MPSLREMCRTGGRCVLLKNVRVGGRCALPEGKVRAAGAPTVPEQSAGRGWSRPPWETKAEDTVPGRAAVRRRAAPSISLFLPGHRVFPVAVAAAPGTESATGGSPGSPVRERGVSAPAGFPEPRPPAPPPPPGIGTPPSPGRGPFLRVPGLRGASGEGVSLGSSGGTSNVGTEETRSSAGAAGLSSLPWQIPPGLLPARGYLLGD